MAEDRTEDKGATHFIGSLVLAPSPANGPACISEFLVVDGQQRLTTLSILLCAIRDHRAQHESPRHRERLDEQFLINIDDQVLRAVRTLIDKPQLEAFSSLFPEDQFEVLQYLAEGFTPDDVYRDIVERRPTDADDRTVDSLAMAIANTTSRITLVSSADELSDILDKPFAAWRVFLHPSQRRAAYRALYNGPAQVTGGPGTGKTAVALHRVKHLLTRAPDSRHAGGRRWRSSRHSKSPTPTRSAP